MPEPRGRGAGQGVGRQRRRGRADVVVLGVGAAPVAVLGVDAQILDRLGGQLGADPREHVGDQRGIETEVGQAVLVQCGQRRLAPRARQPRDDEVAGT